MVIQEQRPPSHGPGRPPLSAADAWLLQRIEELEQELQQKGFSKGPGVTLPLPVASGGTEEITAQAAIDRLTNVSAASVGNVLQKNGSGNAVFGDIPTVPIANGGTGQTTQQAAINALTAAAGASTDQTLVRDSSGDVVWATRQRRQTVTFIATGGSVVYTDQPSTLQFWNADVANATEIDVSWAKSVRLTATVVTAGASGAFLSVRYRGAGYSTAPENYSELGASSTDVTVDIDATGVVTSEDVAIEPSAVSDGVVALALLCDDGDGTEDPAIAMVRLELIG